MSAGGEGRDRVFADVRISRELRRLPDTASQSARLWIDYERATFNRTNRMQPYPIDGVGYIAGRDDQGDLTITRLDRKRPSEAQRRFVQRHYAQVFSAHPFPDFLVAHGAFIEEVEVEVPSASVPALHGPWIGELEDPIMVITLERVRGEGAEHPVAYLKAEVAGTATYDFNGERVTVAVALTGHLANEVSTARPVEVVLDGRMRAMGATRRRGQNYEVTLRERCDYGRAPLPEPSPKPDPTQPASEEVTDR